MRQSSTNPNGSESLTLEQKVRQLWHSILGLDRLPDDNTTTFFTLGGSFFTLTQLFHHYQSDLSPHHELNILDFSGTLTIARHAHLLSMHTDGEIVLTPVRLQNASRGDVQWDRISALSKTCMFFL
jgi:hypothetical protein